jgi:putative FmdB family regulatory protein
MPLYEYHCSKCDKTFEVIRKFSDPPLTEHENCGGQVERLLSAPAFQLKGTGWYATDYAKSGAKAADSSAETTSSENKPAESKSSDSKLGESKATESKASESKSAGSKSAESKSESKSESKPPATQKSE